MEMKTLRVMSWNIRSGFGSFDLPASLAGESQIANIASVIRKSGADIVGLQEVDRFWKRSGGVDQPREIAEVLGMDHRFGANWLPDGGSAGEEVPQYGTALLSAWPIVEYENVPLPTPDGWEQRGALVAVIRLPGDARICVINTHLQVGHEGTEEEGARQRAEQLDTVLGIAASRSMPCVITGDFNALPGSEELTAIETAGSGFADCWATTHSESPGYTIPASPVVEPDRRIDYIFAGGGFRVANVSVLTTERTRVASDHYPVLAEIALVARVQGEP